MKGEEKEIMTELNPNGYILLFHIVFGLIWFSAGFAACYFVYVVRCG